MRPIPASRLGDAHGLLRAISERERIRLDEFVTEFKVEELFPPGLENALGRTRQYVSFARSAGLVNEDRGTVELTDMGKRYVRAADAERPFDVAPAQAEWLRRLLRERHMSDSIYHGAAVALSLCASSPPDFHASTVDFGRAISHLGRAGWDNENTFQSQGERYGTFLRDLELTGADRRLTATGQQTRDELTLPIHASLRDLAAQLNPGGLDAATREGEAEKATAAEPEPAAPAEPEEPAAAEPASLSDTEGDGYEDVGPGAGPSPAAAPPVSRELPAVPSQPPAPVAGAPAAPSAGPPSPGVPAAPAPSAGPQVPTPPAPSAGPPAPGQPPAPPVPSAGPPAPAQPPAPPAPSAGPPTPPADVWDVAAPDDSTRAYRAIAEQGRAAPDTPAPVQPPGAAPPPAAAPVQPPRPDGAQVETPAAPQVQPHAAVPDQLAAAAAAATVASPRPGEAQPAFVAARAIREAAEELGLRLPSPLYAAVAAALAGGHVVLVGPPASGKTTLALAIAKAATRAGMTEGATVVTAGHRWSARDTVGRPGDEEWQRGLIPDAAARGRWLIVDELDRARLDRALGDLSSFLAGIPVTLPDGEAEPPAGWRVVATAATGLSGAPALVRRFAHVRVPPPAEADLHAAIDAAAGGDAVASAAVKRLLGARELGRVGAGAFIAAARYAAARNAAEPADERTLAHEALAVHVAPLLAGLDDEGRRRLAALAG
jgi:MoxR-like ATPase